MNITKSIAWAFIIIGIIILGYFTFISSSDYHICGEEKTDFAVTGQFGDFVGGVVGTIFALTGTLFIILSFEQQTKQNKREAFETSFFEMIHLHRENVSEMEYSKAMSNNKVDAEKVIYSKSEKRKVFRVIFGEFEECQEEVQRFLQCFDFNDYISPLYKTKLDSVIKNNGLNVSIFDIALIDITYNIILFGVGGEGRKTLAYRFREKYKQDLIERLIEYLRLKPKSNHSDLMDNWKEINKKDESDFKLFIDAYHRKDLTVLAYEPQMKYTKYYGGHQHRIGHYFRHLFQTYKYLTCHKDLNEEEKSFYGKMLRAQLSTYEQALLFVSSISSLGMKWELSPDEDIDKKGGPNSKLITRFNLIKDLPGNELSGLEYKKYYPNVRYEADL